MKKEISKEELRNLYVNNNTYEVCKILGISITTLIRYLKEAGIEQKKKGNRKPRRKFYIGKD